MDDMYNTYQVTSLIKRTHSCLQLLI